MGREGGSGEVKDQRAEKSQTDFINFRTFCNFPFSRPRISFSFLFLSFSISPLVFSIFLLQHFFSSRKGGISCFLNLLARLFLFSECLSFLLSFQCSIFVFHLCKPKKRSTDWGFLENKFKSSSRHLFSFRLKF